MPTFILEAEGHRETVQADDIADVRDLAADFAAEEVDPDVGHATAVVRVKIKNRAGVLLETVPVIFEPDEPPCEATEDELHEWDEGQRKQWEDGQAYLLETCGACGLHRVTETDEHGVTHVEYDG